jgi:hypothetical protein
VHYIFVLHLPYHRHHPMEASSCFKIRVSWRTGPEL